MESYPVEFCPGADKEHRDSPRQYAHVFHTPGVICIAQALMDLPEEYRLGVLLHEAGHILAGPQGSEDAANEAAYDYSGVRVYYRDSPYGYELEWVPPGDLDKVRRALGLYNGE